ncbi:MAG: two-component system, OmpR family, phosphate regulon sensor histidine kinase PhoR [Gaiellaceae bacterium]|nr:two-component system, OmpR family, phosphate regulon sensor histidine kinase PhoR [Gaiellaceae bacterium]
MVNEEENRARALVEALGEPVVVLDSERRLIAASPSAIAALGDGTPGRRVGEEALSVEPRPLVLFLAALPELSAYQELRAGFTAAVSHELRTPLARLLVLLESTALPGAHVDELIDQARQEIQQARELIDDVLFLGELDTGREVVSLGRTRALPVVEEVVSGLADRAEHAEVRIVVVGGPAVEVPLRPRMLRVVVENLVSNAVRYAGPGSTATVTVTDEGAGPMVAVGDDGAGVHEADLARLFERFYRADQARSSRGTGLGLAIVKHVVTSAGGTIDARSAPGKGLEIVCRFPRG